MNFTTPEGEFRLRLQKRFGSRWHAVGWPTVGEVRLALLANLELVKPFLAELGRQLSRDREPMPAVCAPGQVGDGLADTDLCPSPQGEARQGDLLTEGPAGEVSDAAAPAGPDGASFFKELESLINRHSMESGSDTPDFLLAEHLKGCLEVYNKTVSAREVWYGRKRSMEREVLPSGFVLEAPGG